MWYIDSRDIQHIPSAALSALYDHLGAEAPDTRPYSGGQRGWETREARDAARTEILARHPRPAQAPMLTVRQAALRSGPASEAHDWA